jgi:hypothetical protein
MEADQIYQREFSAHDILTTDASALWQTFCYGSPAELFLLMVCSQIVLCKN